MPNSEENLLDEALKRPAGPERAAFLDQACGQSLELRHRLESLVRAAEEGGSFLESPTVSLTTLVSTISQIPISERPGDRIGRYKLLEQIGEGGCGVVYVAEQQEPVRRRVALKVIKLGMDTKQVVARFEAERQALAMMDHPNISKVLDAGATATGRPYFVMELVRGIKITDYCDKNNLTTTERIQLIIQVCSAIEHAHEKGIIHRDIKPSNILVTLHDGVPVPKVIDFGIAKATSDQKLTDKTIYTAFEQFIGTPAYMSPEQAEMSGLDIDRRSDIYSLGVLLYELLTSRTPFDAGNLLKAGLDQMRRIIREHEPQRPSTRLSTFTDADLSAVASRRHSDPAKLVSALKGDLDWIVMKILEKDRTRRYDSAASLAADLKHFLSDEPVTARPPSFAYRIQKFLIRNRPQVIAAGFTLLCVIVALVIGMKLSGSTEKAVVKPEERKLSLDSAPAALPAPAPKSMGVVSGIVVDEKTGSPLAQARVRVGAPSIDMRGARGGGSGVFETHTDEKGRFKLEIPRESRISIDALLPGYESAAGSLMAGSSMEVEDLPFDAGQLHDVRLALHAALYVAGRTVDEQGHVLEGVFVTATVQNSEMYAYVGTAVSDANGRFELFDFPLVDDPELRGVLTFEKGDRLKTTLTNVYALPPKEARALAVAVPRGHDVRGTVMLASGRPVTKITVTALPYDDFGMAKEATTDVDGRFEIQGLPKGRILIRAHSLVHEQKGDVKVDFKGGEEVSLKLAPVVLTQPLKLTSVLGMRLVTLTPELCDAYDIEKETEGVLVVEASSDVSRPQLPGLREGCYFWMVGSRPIRDVMGWVNEILRVNALDPGASDFSGDVGARGAVKIVYSTWRGSNTQTMKLSDADIAELRQVAAALERESRKGGSK